MATVEGMHEYYSHLRNKLPLDSSTAELILLVFGVLL
jgi:hypothetical protein